MNERILTTKVDNYKHWPNKNVVLKKHTSGRNKRRNKHLKWVNVASEEFKKFVRTLKANYKLTQPDQAGAIGWGRVSYSKKQKHMEHSQYIIDAQYFKDAKSYLKLCKANNLIDNLAVALLNHTVSDTVFEGEIDKSNAYQRYFSNDAKESIKRDILQPVKHSTMLRDDVSGQRLIDDNRNVKFHFESQRDKVKASLGKNDLILSDVVTKLKSIMKTNDGQKKRLVSMENTCLHIHHVIERKSELTKQGDCLVDSKIDSAKNQTVAKAPWAQFGLIYDTEEKQFMHKRKALVIKI